MGSYVKCGKLPPVIPKTCIFISAQVIQLFLPTRGQTYSKTNPEKTALMHHTYSKMSVRDVSIVALSFTNAW